MVPKNIECRVVSCAGLRVLFGLGFVLTSKKVKDNCSSSVSTGYMSTGRDSRNSNSTLSPPPRAPSHHSLPSILCRTLGRYRNPSRSDSDASRIRYPVIPTYRPLLQSITSLHTHCTQHNNACARRLVYFSFFFFFSSFVPLLSRVFCTPNASV